MEVFNDRFQVIKPISHGRACDVYKAIDRKTGGIIAIKIEKNPENPIFSQEFKMNNNVRSVQGLAKVLHHGVFKGKRFIAMNYLGKSLGFKFLECYGKFSDGCVLRIANELLFKIENLHKIGYVHNNLKPDNILLGYSLNWQSLYFVGLSSASNIFLDIRNTPQNGGLTQNNIDLLYSSTNVMRKITPSMRDDIESIAYILLHFHCGSLPWKNSNSNNEVLRLKIGFPSTKTNDQLFAVLLNIIKYAQSLDFSQEPDFRMLRNNLTNFAKNKKILRIYDWAISNDKLKKQMTLDKSKMPINKHFSIENDKKIAELKDWGKCLEKKRVRFVNKSQNRYDLTKKNNIEDSDSKKLERVETEIMEDYPQMNNRIKILQQRKEFLEVLESNN